MSDPRGSHFLIADLPIASGYAPAMTARPRLGQRSFRIAVLFYADEEVAHQSLAQPERFVREAALNASSGNRLG